MCCVKGKSCYLIQNSPQARKDYALLLSFVGQARLQFAGLHSLFLALWCIVIEIGGAMRDLLFWCLMYLYSGFICCRRCFYGNRCICTGLIFAVADAFFETDVSVTYFSLNLQILFSLSVMYNCIYILPFLGFKDTPFANFASTSHIFDNVKMLPIKILHLQSPRIHYRRYRRSISFEFYLLHNLSQYITYKKIDIRNSSEYGVSVGDT